MALVAGPGGIGAGLFLCALRLCQHHRPRHLNVHSIPGSNHRRWSTGLSGGFVSGVLLKPGGIIDALRDYLSANLFWFGLCEPENMVAAGSDYLTSEHTRLDSCGFALVEVAGVVVIILSTQGNEVKNKIDTRLETSRRMTQH